jgi:hypothetical protein
MKVPMVEDIVTARNTLRSFLGILKVVLAKVFQLVPIDFIARPCGHFISEKVQVLSKHGLSGLGWKVKNPFVEFTQVVTMDMVQIVGRGMDHGQACVDFLRRFKIEWVLGNCVTQLGEVFEYDHWCGFERLINQPEI